jgi:hypothetical protein
MSVSNIRLDITVARRILGTAMVAAMLGVALIATFRPHVFDHLKTVNNPLLPSNPALISLFMFCCTCIGSQFIVYPCLFSRFPRWMYKCFTESHIEEMAKRFFGAPSRDNTTNVIKIEDETK